jgi:hypothetical protein
MIRRSALLFIFLFGYTVISVAQTATLKGVFTDENKVPVPGIKVILVETNSTSTTDASGVFEFRNIPYGTYSIETKDELFEYSLSGIKVDQQVVDLSSLTFSKKPRPAADPDIPTVTLSDDELSEASSQNVSGVLNSSRDAFISATTYNFSAARFRLRGYDDENFTTLMNDAPMTDLTTGRTMYSTWSGLNDVMRSREATLGLAPASYSFGSVGGVYSIDSRASHQRKQLQVSYSAANRNYENRLMATYGSGLLKGGWYVALSYSRRWSQEGYIPGTFYDGHAYFASVEKFINSKHSVALTVFGAPVENGRSAAAVKEMYDLAGTHYYNPDWGYQDGKVRNAVVANNNRPVAVLTHEWTISEKSSLESAVSFTSGKNNLSRLDWYNAADPRPDYYRKLPSYVLNNTNNQDLYLETYNLFKTNENVRQVDWDHLYDVNYHSGDTAAYVIEDRITDAKIFTFNTIYNKTVSDHTDFSAGASYQLQNSEYYKELKDLLGGKFFVDLNQFADQTIPGNIQNNLDNPNRRIYVGDKYGYDYEAHVMQLSGWAQGLFKFNKIDFFGALQLSNTSFYRTGKVRNGVYANNSLGDSRTESFINYAFKAGMTYKINGRNYLFINSSSETRAPHFEDAYISPKTQNAFANDLKEETVTSVEGGYLLKAPKIKLRAIGYLTQFNDQTKTWHYYNDDQRTFVNYTVSGINTRNLGAELAAEWMLYKGFSANAVAALGQYFYTDRPVATITQDNMDALLASGQTVYAKNLHVGGTPENAYSVGISYRSDSYWFVNMDFNYFDNIYIPFNPARRTAAAVDQVDGGSDLRNEILSQEKASGEYTLNISGGWSWKLNNKFKNLKRNTFLVLNFGVNNFLDNQNLVSGGYEQLRFDYLNQSVRKFDTKYYYAPGINFFVNLTLRLN